MQSCLEIRGMEERKKEIVKSDYNNSDITHNYSASHVDALSDGDIQGKGSGHGGHTYWKPHYFNNNKDFINVIKYDNFDTSVESNIGGCFDINGRKERSGRKRMFNANIFTPEYQYNADIIGTQIKK